MNNSSTSSFNIGSSVKLSWFTLLAVFLILIIFKPLDSIESGLPTILIFTHFVLTSIFIGSSSSKYSKYLFWAFILRFVVFIVDIYFKDVFTLPHSGADSEAYFSGSVYVSNNLNLILNSSGMRIGLYQKLLGLIMWFTGPYRIIVQYLNVMTGLMVVYTVYKTINLLHIGEKIKKRIVLIAALFPTSLIMSGILLREIIPTWLVALSLFYFVRWFVETKSKKDILLSFIMVGIASAFHSGVIGVFFGYAFAFLFYNHETNKLKLTTRTVGSFVVLVLFLGVFLLRFGDSILFKFSNIEGGSDVFDNITSAAGGSAYLAGLTINNPLQMIIYGPVRAVYFLFSPMPWNWRGGIDLFTFFTDSILYLIVIYSIYKNRKSLNSKQGKLVLILLISIIVTSFVFGLGVSNAGTALRHRQKIAPLFFMILGVIMQERGKHTKK